MLTYPCSSDPSIPSLRFKRFTFLYHDQNINCVYSLESSQRDDFNVYPEPIVLAKMLRRILHFSSENGDFISQKITI